MKTIWECDLPTNEKSEDYLYESPIFVKDKQVYFISKMAGEQMLHIIDADNGVGSTQVLSTRNKNLPKDYFFLEYENNILIYTDDLFVCRQKSLEKVLDLSEKGTVMSYLQRERKMFLACGRQNTMLICYDLETLSIDWEINIANTKPYQAGELSFYENMISCYGRDQLLFIEMDSGKILDSIKIPRIDKLFQPIRLDENHMLIGYTNWSNAGVLKYDMSTRKVIWRHKRKFEGPQLKCKIYQHNGDVIWVKNGTELICLSSLDGNEKYQLRTSPWLYTELRFVQDDVLYGTAGADGYINNLDVKNGELKWQILLKNGCAYFDLYKDTVIVGDFSKEIKQIDRLSGSILQTHCVDGEVVGDIKVCQGSVYTVIWGDSEKAIRLVRIEI